MPQVVIFEGPQDIGKSKLIKTLAGRRGAAKCPGRWKGRKPYMLMKGAWVVDGDGCLRLRTEESRVKSFITMCNDANRVKIPFTKLGR